MKNLMTVRGVLATVAVAGLMCASTVGPALAAAPAAPPKNDKTTICHRTGSATNPYVQITISNSAVAAHLKQHDVTRDWSKSGYKAGQLLVGSDFVPAPGMGCTIPTPVPPTNTPTPLPTNTPTPLPTNTPVVFVACVVSIGVTQDATTVTGTSGADTIDCSMVNSGRTINGFDGDDTITGTPFNDIIDGGEGNNTITALNGDNTITSGAGNDTITAGPEGNNTINSGAGDDTITGANGNDTINAGDGNDTVTGGLGSDTIEGGNGNDTLSAAPDGNDTITDVGDGNDTCNATPCP
jgi:Ca2+-binding RTX toxin-like protein